MTNVGWKWSNGRITVVLVCLALVAMYLIPSVAMAQSLYQPIEWGAYQNGRVKYSLSYAGSVKGCKIDQPNNTDEKFWINANASYNPDNYRIFSSDWLVGRVFQDKSPMGNLNSRPYLCLGQRDTVLAGGAGNVAQRLFVWVK